MSDYCFNKALENDFLRIDEPKGTFFLREVQKPLLILASGTGIAPIVAMLLSLELAEDYH